MVDGWTTGKDEEGRSIRVVEARRGTVMVSPPLLAGTTSG